MMVSRPVGRGRCPKCRREGVAVVKAISGRRYLYFKHGDEWCYVGPLRGGLRLAGPYLVLTVAEPLSSERAGRFTRGCVLALAAVMLALAYLVTIMNAPYGDALALALTIAFTLFTALAIAWRGGGGGVLEALAARGMLLYVAASAGILLAAMVVTLWIASPVWLELPRARLPAMGDVEGTWEVVYLEVPVRLPLPPVLTASAALAYLARPLLSDKARLALVMLTSPALACAALLFTALYIPADPRCYTPSSIVAMYSRPETWIYMLTFLSVSSACVGVVTAALASLNVLLTELASHAVIVRATRAGVQASALG